MICDAHVHVGQLGDTRTKRNFPPEEIAAILKRQGVAEFIFSSMNAQAGRPFDVVERDAVETKAVFGPGAHAFYWLAGRFYDADPEIKALDSGIWEGVKLHELETPWVKERPGDLDRILSILEERGIPVQFHTGEDKGCYPHELLPFAKRHPRLRIDFAHCRPVRETIDCLKDCPNLFTDTAFLLPEHYPELVAAGVEDRVMFGTDLPIQAGFYEGTIDELYRNDLEGAREYGYSEAVMSGNFRRFLGGVGEGGGREAGNG